MDNIEKQYATNDNERSVGDNFSRHRTGKNWVVL